MSNAPENNWSDKQLIDRVLRGDHRAFAVILKNTENLVAQIVCKLITVPEDRKDIAQDIYLKAFHHLKEFKFQSKLSTWIAQIAYNTSLSWIDKKKPFYPGNLTDEEEHRGTTTIPAFIETESSVSQKELSGILNKEIHRLPVLYQTLITLYHHESLSYEELSQITDLPLGTVKSYLFRARKMLKQSLLSKYKKEAL